MNPQAVAEMEAVIENGTSAPANGDRQNVSEPIAKGVGGAEKGRVHVNLPPGAVRDQKIKVQKPDGSQTWRAFESGVVMAPDGTPASARHPNPGG